MLDRVPYISNTCTLGALAVISRTLLMKGPSFITSSHLELVRCLIRMGIVISRRIVLNVYLTESCYSC